MTHTEFVANLAKEEGITLKKAKSIVKSMVGIIQHETKKREGGVSIASLGVFTTITRKPRIASNPRTGEKIKVGAKRVPKFRPSKFLSEAVKPKSRVKKKAA